MIMTCLYCTDADLQTIACLDNKAAVVTKMLVKSIYLGVHFDSFTTNYVYNERPKQQRCIDNYANYNSVCICVMQ